MDRVDVEAKLLRWARERAGLRLDALAGRFPRIEAWERGEAQPTFKQLERFARGDVHTRRVLFLREPPVERIPIADFRTCTGSDRRRPSANLLDTIYLCQQRQNWYRDFVRTAGEGPILSIGFVGSTSTEDDIPAIAARMRRLVRFDVEERRQCRTWVEALREFVGRVETLGVLVMASGVVGSNSRRKLDAREFRGFALADSIAPMIFINRADTKAAQMFTLAHELGHVWLGSSGVSDAESAEATGQATEHWCNRVAAEMLVPLDVLKKELSGRTDLGDELRRLARRFKVSTLVILRRISDAGGMTRAAYRSAYAKELDRLMALRAGNGGDFYVTPGARVNRRFARAIVGSTVEADVIQRVLPTSRSSEDGDLQKAGEQSRTVGLNGPSSGCGRGCHARGSIGVHATHQDPGCVHRARHQVRDSLPDAANGARPFRSRRRGVNVRPG